MKKFDLPEINLENLEPIDVITTSDCPTYEVCKTELDDF